MAPARRSSRKTGATGVASTPPLSTPVPASQPAKQTTLKFTKINTRQQSAPEARPKREFLDLPAEMRLLIYRQMFPCERVDIYAIKGSLHKAEDAHYVSGGHLAILTTCRSIYTEAKPVLYSNTEFCIHIQDYYWLHMWTKDLYEEVFDVDEFHEEPRPFQWTYMNPWLQDSRSIVPLDNVRVLTLAAKCNMGETEHTYTWTGQIKHTLRAASNIQKLHIELQAPDGDDLSQDATDLMLEHFVHHIKCNGTVTAEMNLALGALDFDSGSYYKMLDRFKGVDKTHDVFSRNMANLQVEHAETVQHLREKVCLLRSETEDRIKFTDTQSTWVNYHATQAVPYRLEAQIKVTLKEMVDLEWILQGLEKRIKMLKYRFESLEVRKPA